MGFLPGTNWIGEIKTRYFYNSYNKHQTVTLRPGLTYIIFSNGRPLFNLFLQQELYFPVNYGVSVIYEQWTYLGLLYHVNSHFMLGIYGSYRSITWGTSDDFEDTNPGESYEVNSTSFMMGFNAIVRFSL